MTPTTLSELIAQLRVIGSDKQSVEVKSSVGKEVLSTLSAFANGNGGTLIIGLSEQDDFTPIKKFSASTAQDQLETRCQQLIPPVRPRIDVIEFESSHILVAEIDELPARDKPCYVAERGLYKGSYIRTGDGDTRLPQYEVNRLVEEHAQPTWDEDAIPDATLEDIEGATLDDFLQVQKERRPKTFANGRTQHSNACESSRTATPRWPHFLSWGTIRRNSSPD